MIKPSTLPVSYPHDLCGGTMERFVKGDAYLVAPPWGDGFAFWKDTYQCDRCGTIIALYEQMDPAVRIGVVARLAA